MSDKKLNPSQLEAVKADNHKILVSAGAGAGKSGTLAERVARLIVDGKANLAQMLIMSFNREAAYSIRRGISKTLQSAYEESGNENLKESISLLYSADISTIHSFCMDLVKSGAAILDIDETSGIIDESIRKRLFRQAVSDAVEAISKPTYPKARKALFGSFKRAADARFLPDMCLEIYDTLMGIPDPFARISHLVSEITEPDNPWADEIFKYNKLLLLTKEKHLEDLKDLYALGILPDKFQEIAGKDILILQEFLKEVQAAATIDSLIMAINKAVLSADTFRKSGKMDSAEENAFEKLKQIHSFIKNKPTGSSARNFLQYSLKPLQAVKSTPKTALQRVQKQLQGLIVLLEEVHNCFMAIKVNERVLDYADLEQYAYQLLTNDEHPDIRQEIQKKYRYIFVDECQDVSAIQHAIIRAMDSGKNYTYYVGDIKQSIYRFRHADPLQFLSMRDSYSDSPDADCRKIFFQYNYRSSEIIIEGVNHVFADLLTRELTEIDYEPGDYLLYGNENIPSLAKNEIILVNKCNEKDPVSGEPLIEPMEAQCAAVAEKINELVRDGVKYKDIVILLRAGSSGNNGQNVVDWLTHSHVPCYYNGKSTFLATPEIAQLVEVLKTINNDHQDMPLIATLRSVIFKFTDQELAEIRIKSEESPKASFSDCFHALADRNTTPTEKRCNEARAVIRRWSKEAAEINRTSAIIWDAMKTSDYYATQMAFPDGEIRQKNLDAFYAKSLAYEELGSYKLADFLAYIDEASQAKGGTDDPIPMRDNDDFVRVMTIHASKGLEFKNIIVMDMQRKIHHRDMGGIKVNVETETSATRSLGLYMPAVIKREGFQTFSNNYGKDAFLFRNYLMELAEESRLLYVAMTRAQERLIMVGTYDLEKQPEVWYVTNKAYRTLNVSSMLDMIMYTALNGERISLEEQTIENTLWKISCVKAKNIDDEATERKEIEVHSVKSDIDFDEMWGSIAISGTTLPAKTAVSYIINDAFDNLEEDDELPKEESEETVAGISLSDEMEMPEFLTEKTEVPGGAELGTLVHKLMLLLDFKQFRDKTDIAEVKAMLQNEISNFGSAFSTTQEETISRTMFDGISRFLVSPAGQLVCHSSMVKKEQDFVMRVNVNGYPILVQGVIDLLYKGTNDEWHILDYKTSRDTREETLIGKYKEQLNYYRQAVENIRKETVAKMEIVALRTGEVYEVPRENQKYQ